MKSAVKKRTLEKIAKALDLFLYTVKKQLLKIKESVIVNSDCPSIDSHKNKICLSHLEL